MEIYSAITLINPVKQAMEMGCKGNNLFSYYFYDMWKNDFSFFTEHSRNILLDSGAFSILQQSKKSEKPNINVIESFLNNYCRFIRKHDNDIIQGYFELDLGQFINYFKVKQYRAKIQKVTDKIIPVWHQYLGIQEFKSMVNTYDYIAIGGLAGSNRRPPVNYFKPFVKYAHKKGKKIHLLGLTEKKLLKNLPFDSVDSTAWHRCRFGEVTKEIGKDGSRNVQQLNTNYISNNYEKLITYDYIQSIKQQDYYRQYWQGYTNKQEKRIQRRITI